MDLGHISNSSGTTLLLKEISHCSFKGSGTTGTNAHSFLPPRISQLIKRLKLLPFPSSYKCVSLMFGLLFGSTGEGLQRHYQFQYSSGVSVVWEMKVGGNSSVFKLNKLSLSSPSSSSPPCLGQ